MVGLPVDYDNRVKKLIATFSRSPKGRRWRYTDYALMYPMWGENYRPGRDLMIVGRATNGWPNPWRITDGTIDSTAIVQTAKAYSNQDRMDWVTKCWDRELLAGTAQESRYPIRQSAFWQIAFSLTQTADETQEGPWAARLAWSNIYKIAPSEVLKGKRNGNPTSSEIAGQLPNSVELLQMELDFLQPRAVIMMVDTDWLKPFRDVLKVEPVSGRFVVGAGKYGKTRVVVTVRPEGKPRLAFVEEVQKYLPAVEP